MEYCEHNPDCWPDIYSEKALDEHRLSPATQIGVGAEHGLIIVEQTAAPITSH